MCNNPRITSTLPFKLVHPNPDGTIQVRHLFRDERNFRGRLGVAGHDFDGYWLPLEIKEPKIALP